ncbi:PAAR domain-containing protein [Paludibacterium purpuratum]|uniref:Putative Zn-binding protein involved in type VI secretion n=1 Tax=Paludibacterium purpuratum TaxID=1144873 RepID=A0A4R7BCK7_9NEIS|nr:PAAR domain-containing protein [Paludibacterium purpuratum]TDR82774.1 putative Zn-binding protein involved in type VI secretion [Paludibacterium purpuratum]
MPPAARLTDMHTCPVVSVWGSPHGGGPIVGPGITNVLIGGLCAAVVGDSALCSGAPEMPNSIVKGSTTVLIGGRPAARVGDPTAHGGNITLGILNVLIGG